MGETERVTEREKDSERRGRVKDSYKDDRICMRQRKRGLEREGETMVAARYEGLK